MKLEDLTAAREDSVNDAARRLHAGLEKLGVRARLESAVSADDPAVVSARIGRQAVTATVHSQDDIRVSVSEELARSAGVKTLQTLPGVDRALRFLAVLSGRLRGD